MPRDAKGNPRSGRGRSKFADSAHEDEQKEEKKEERQLNGGGSVKGTRAKPPDKKMGDSEDRAAMRHDAGEGSQDDDGDIADVTEIHGPAHHMEADMDHAAGKFKVTSMHGEKRHSKTYQDPMQAMRHVTVASGQPDPMAQQQQQQPGGGADTMSMLKDMNMGGSGYTS